MPISFTQQQRNIELEKSKMGKGKGSGKDLFLIDTRCQLNKTIPKLFEDNGYDVKVCMKLKFFGMNLSC